MFFIENAYSSISYPYQGQLSATFASQTTVSLETNVVRSPASQFKQQRKLIMSRDLVQQSDWSTYTRHDSSARPGATERIGRKLKVCDCDWKIQFFYKTQ